MLTLSKTQQALYIASYLYASQSHNVIGLKATLVELGKYWGERYYDTIKKVEGPLCTFDCTGKEFSTGIQHFTRLY